MKEIVLSTGKPQAVNSTTALAPFPQPATSMAIVPTTIDETALIAARFAKSALVPTEMRGKEGDVFFTIMYGLELGLPPASSMRAISIVKGKPFLDAATSHALCLRHPECEYFRRVPDKCERGKQATFEAKRAGYVDSVTFTMDDAKAAGLIKDGGGWTKYPDRMLEARARMALARIMFPEKLAGVYCPEEASDFGDAVPPPASAFERPAASDVIDVGAEAEPNDSAKNLANEPSPIDVAAAELTERIRNTDDLRELSKLAGECKEIKEQSADYGETLLKVYKEQRDFLAKAEQAQ